MRGIGPQLVRHLLGAYARCGGGVAPIVVVLLMFLTVWQAHLFTADVYQGISILLLPVAAWITFVMLDCETRTQEEITAVAVRGLPRLRVAKTLLAWGVCLLLLALLLVPTVLFLFESPTIGALLALAAAFTATGCVLAALIHAGVGQRRLPQLVLTAVVTLVLLQAGRFSPWVALINDVPTRINDAPAGHPVHLLRDGGLVAVLCVLATGAAARLWRYRGV